MRPPILSLLLMLHKDRTNLGEMGRCENDQCVVSCRQRHFLILSALLPKGVIQVDLGTP